MDFCLYYIIKYLCVGISWCNNYIAKKNKKIKMKNIIDKIIPYVMVTAILLFTILSLTVFAAYQLQ